MFMGSSANKRLIFLCTPRTLILLHLLLSRITRIHACAARMHISHLFGAAPLYLALCLAHLALRTTAPHSYSLCRASAIPITYALRIILAHAHIFTCAPVRALPRHLPRRTASLTCTSCGRACLHCLHTRICTPLRFSCHCSTAACCLRASLPASACCHYACTAIACLRRI